MLFIMAHINVAKSVPEYRATILSSVIARTCRESITLFKLAEGTMNQQQSEVVVGVVVWLVVEDGDFHICISQILNIKIGRVGGGGGRQRRTSVDRVTDGY